MQPHMENPATCDAGFRKLILAGASINPEINTPHQLR